MPHFDANGFDTWICQICTNIFNALVRSEWRPDLTGCESAGNVCPTCLAKAEPKAAAQPKAQTAIETTEEASHDMRGMLKPGLRERYALAGNATITIRNPKTGVRFTYKIAKSENRPGWYVKLLNGTDNVNDYVYMGMIDDRGFRATQATKMTADAPSWKAFLWLTKNWEDGRVEVWHEGRCGRCGRKLTVPESVEAGIGPDCAGRMAA